MTDKVHRLHDASNEIVVDLLHLKTIYLLLHASHYQELGMTPEEGWQEFWNALTGKQ